MIDLNNIPEFHDGDTYKSIREGANEIHKSLADRVKALEESGGGGGVPGPAGYSPEAKVEQQEDGAVITITDQSGTTTATIKNGKDGAPGTDGQPGAQGPAGPQGPAGRDGTKIYSGADAPSPDQGDVGDFYFQSNGDFYQKTGANWEKKGSSGGSGDSGYKLDIENPDTTAPSSDQFEKLKKAIDNKDTITINHSDETTDASVGEAVIVAAEYFDDEEGNEVIRLYYVDPHSDVYTINVIEYTKHEDGQITVNHYSKEAINQDTIDKIKSIFIFDYKEGNDNYEDDEIQKLITAIKEDKIVLFRNNTLHSYQLPISVLYDIGSPDILAFTLGSIDPDNYNTFYKYSLTKKNTVWKQVVSSDILLSRDDIVNSLEQEGSNTTVLSSKQGYILKSLIDSLSTKLQTLEKVGIREVVIVDKLPETGESNKLYLVEKSGSINDIYDEYLWIEDKQKFDPIGSTAIDLSNYYNKTEIDDKLNNKLDKTSDELKTESKDIIGAINEVNSKSGGGSSGGIKAFNELHYGEEYEIEGASVGDLNVVSETGHFGTKDQPYKIYDESNQLLVDAKLNRMYTLRNNDKYCIVNIMYSGSTKTELASVTRLSDKSIDISLIGIPLANKYRIYYNTMKYLFVSNEEGKVDVYTANNQKIINVQSKTTLDIDGILVGVSNTPTIYFFIYNRNTQKISKYRLDVYNNNKIVFEYDLNIEVTGYRNIIYTNRDGSPIYMAVCGSKFKIYELDGYDPNPLNTYEYSGIIVDNLANSLGDYEFNGNKFVLNCTGSLSNKSIVLDINTGDIKQYDYPIIKVNGQLYEINHITARYSIPINYLKNIEDDSEVIIWPYNAQEKETIPYLQNGFCCFSFGNNDVLMLCNPYELYSFSNNCRLDKIDIITSADESKSNKATTIYYKLSGFKND